MEFIAGVFVGAVGMALGRAYEAWRVRMMRRYIAKTTDEWAEDEARALEAAEEILRGEE
jgi:hypothetical protein